MRRNAAISSGESCDHVACKQAGWRGPPPRCTSFGGKAVGAKFDAVLATGRSRPWPDAPQVFTGIREVSGRAIAACFAAEGMVGRAEPGTSKRVVKTAGGPSTRDKLIDATFRVVARDGLEAASVKTIAAEAGVAPGLMHYHFASKDAVIEAALERSVAAFAARGAERRARVAPGEQLKAFIADTRDAITSERAFYKVRLALAARALTSPTVAALLARQTAVAVEETAAVLAAARGVPVDDRHRTLARLLKAIFDGVMLATLTDPAFDAGAAADLLEEAIAGWMPA